MGTPSTLAEWRDRIDDLDRQLVALLSQRARCAQAIGELKRSTDMPIYEPNREKLIFSGPLADSDLQQIYERIIDVMRSIQKDKIIAPAESAPASAAPAASTHPSTEPRS
jgi:chorismate mutase